MMNNQNKDSEIRKWAMFIHFSNLSNVLVPLSGFILSVILWQIKKHEMPEIDAHGKMVTNWIISYIIYAVVSVILIIISSAFVGGIFGILVYPIASFVFAVFTGVGILFPIIGGIQASRGKLWKYPLCISIL